MASEAQTASRRALQAPYPTPSSAGALPSPASGADHESDYAGDAMEVDTEGISAMSNTRNNSVRLSQSLWLAHLFNLSADPKNIRQTPRGEQKIQATAEGKDKEWRDVCVLPLQSNSLTCWFPTVMN
jgi:hypothetical protein